MDKKPVTRIDIEKLGQTMVSVRSWFEGWHEGQAHDHEDILEGRSIDSLLFEYEKQGYTVEMASNSQGRALRGKTTRIDFLILGGKYFIHKYPFGWTAKTRPIQELEKTQAEWEQAVLWCEASGWTVYRWPEGARAWRGKAMPIHDAHTIRRMRTRIDKIPDDPRKNYDLAFYW